MTDPRVARGMARQLARLRALVAGGAARVGWKVGFNVPAVQRMLGLSGPVVGHLTLATALVAGEPHSLAGATRVGVEPEVAIHLGADVPAGATAAAAREAIVGLGPALEVIDVDRPFEDLETLCAENVFHRAFLIGPTDPGAAGGVLSGVTARVLHRGAEVASLDAGAAAGDLAAVVRFVADFLAPHGERLVAGDWIIAGSLVAPVWVAAGDVVVLELGGIGDVELEVVA
jgi:2-keto-4-pentenoate hydratase